MTIKIGVREITRNFSILEKYDYVEIEDKKTHQTKGFFLSPEYAKEFDKYIKEKSAKDKADKLSRLKMYAGRSSVDSAFDNLTSSEIKKKISLDTINE